jgi:hypothetical protein
VPDRMRAGAVPDRASVLAPDSQRLVDDGVLAGALPVLLILTFSRWGSTIGIGSLYLTDLLIGLAVLHAALGHRGRRGPGSFGGARIVPMPPIFALLLTYVVIRALLALGSSDVLDWVRDAAPYFYGFLAVMSATSYLASSPRRRRRTARLLVVGLAIHLAWSAVVQLTPLGEVQITVPLVGAPIFQPRPDIEAALNSVFAAFCLRAIIVHRHRGLSLVGLGLAMVVVLAQGTRAGTLALLASLAMSFVLTYSGLGRLDGRRVAMTLAAPAVLIIGVIVLPLTQPGQRIIATVFPDQAVSAAQQNAEGTAQARGLVWSGVIDWTVASTPRLLVGSGFGNDFLSESKTLQYLEGTDYTNVRSPHDYWIGSFARMGLLGVALLLGSVLLAVAVIVRSRIRIAQDSLSFIAAIVVIAIIPVASLGVVLEAPFGAVPFFWAIGVVYTFRTGGVRLDGPVRHESRQRRPSLPSSTPAR